MDDLPPSWPRCGGRAARPAWPTPCARARCPCRSSRRAGLTSTGRPLRHTCTVSAAGVDHDPHKIDRARALYGHLNRLHFVRADAAEYLRNLPPSSVAACLSIFGAFSFSDPRPLLTASAAALRPGGLLLMTIRADDRHDRVTLLKRR
ncbi:methyltransferase domain-containing protein [Streptomyces triculaminicus]|uniref:methyltransferase domain-containing protein n=1 Tax=Streptomyces triculaminicus TaxID=2816232 RepID=UPI0037D10324